MGAKFGRHRERFRCRTHGPLAEPNPYADRTETLNARAVEIASLVAIAILVAVGGRIVLANLAAHKAFAALAIVALIVGAAFALRRTYRAPNDETRVVITKYVAYLAAAILALWDVLAPAKWIPGSCIAAIEVALVFGMITIWARRNAAGGT